MYGTAVQRSSCTMKTLRLEPARPKKLSPPSYPRVIALGAILFAGCGGRVDEIAPPADAGDTGTREAAPDSDPPDTGEPISAGGMAYPYDSEPIPEPDAGPSDAPPQKP